MSAFDVQVLVTPLMLRALHRVLFATIFVIRVLCTIRCIRFYVARIIDASEIPIKHSVKPVYEMLNILYRYLLRFSGFLMFTETVDFDSRSK